MNNGVKLDASEGSPQYRVISAYNGTDSDEINLGDLIRNLISEWKTMVVVIAIGIACSIALAFYLSFNQPKTYLVESILRIPSITELGVLSEQSILEIGPTEALEKVVSQLLDPGTIKKALVSSGWVKEQSENGTLFLEKKAKAIGAGLSVAVIRHDYYNLKTNQKTPFKEVSVSMRSQQPEEATEFIQTLIKIAQDQALLKFARDANSIRNTEVNGIQKQLKSLSLAERQSREAEIMRLQEANRLAISRLRLQIDSKIRQAIKDRDYMVVRLTEALKIATELGIVKPVIEQLSGPDSIGPLYFRGSRLLKAELLQLQERKDYRPFAEGLSELEAQIFKIENDPKIAALQSRVNDAIYAKKYNQLQSKKINLLAQATQFDEAIMAVVARPALVSTMPTRNPMLIVLAGIFLSGFLALVVALIRVSMRNSELRQKEITPTD